MPGDSSLGPMPAAACKSKTEQCQRLPNDKDRLRMIANVATQFLLTPEQAAGFCKTMTSFGSTCEAAASLQEATSDDQGFLRLALGLCKFPEDRVAMCGILGTELVPLEAATPTNKASPARKLSINSGLGQSAETARPVGF